MPAASPIRSARSSGESEISPARGARQPERGQRLAQGASQEGQGREALPLPDGRPELARQESLLSLLASSPRLQRQCACGAPSAGGGSCSACEGMASLQGLQRKALAIGAADDPLEREADQVAERVMRMEAPGEKPLETSRLNRPVVSRSTDGAVLAGEAPASVPAALASPGQPLAPSERAFFEPRFGADFSQVRVHTGELAQQSARDVHALAYTVGSHVVFGAGRYAPSSTVGRRLLAHELTHVVQQSGKRPMVQRAETDTVPGCTGLVDSQTDVDTHVNAELATARSRAGTPLNGMVVANHIRHSLGRDVELGRTAIEIFAQTLDPTKISLPPKSATKYSGVRFRIWNNPVFPILNPTMKVNGICIGSDKLGHFFQQGATFFHTQTTAGLPAAEEESERSEGGGFGLISTGVFSNADLEANRQGGSFYRDLVRTPTMTFSISNFISSRWNEVSNPNFYEESVGHQVWANLLSGNWTGFSFPGVPLLHEPISLDLSATTAGNVTGTFSRTVAGRLIRGGTISSGRISFGTTTVRGRDILGSNTTFDPVSRIEIEFDWAQGHDSGKGSLESSGERRLVGSWGNASSSTDKGTLEFNRT